MGSTIKELAKRCGLSVSAVSKALNNYPDISEKTREMVLKAAEEMGYFPNAIARGLKTNRTYNLGVILDDTTSDSLLHNFFIVILNGFKREAELRGYDVTLISRDIGNQRLSYLNHCHYRNVDGVCLMCVDFYDAEIAELAQSDLPLVSIDHQFEARDCVNSDNQTGIRDLMEYILSMGHTRVAYLHGTPSNVTEVRLKTFCEVMAAHGITVPDAYVRETEYHSTTAAFAATQAMLGLAEPPTCVLLPDDYSALGGIDAIQNAGLTVGVDVSVAGCDGTSLIQKIRPRLTTFKQDGREMGRRAAIRLIERIEHPDSPIAPPDLVPGWLLAGETVAKLS